MKGIALRDTIRELSLFRARAIISGLIAALLMLVIVARLAYLQVLHHNHYTTLSHNNRVNILPVAPTRGLIYDRNGLVLAENVTTYSLEMVPERVLDMEETLAVLGGLVTVSEDDIERFRAHLKRKRRFEEIPLRFRLSDEEVARVAVNRHRLPGVEINSRLSRHYPFGAQGSHLIGYVGRINEAELRRLDPSNYSATAHVGKVGVERSYEDHLHGRVGFQQVETNAYGRVLRVLERTPPVPGSNLHLNIDMRVQRAAEQAFGEERGALVALDPETGAIIALASVPNYDPNLFVNGIDSKTYKELSESPARPLFNRALRGQYPPGSTTKPVVGLAGLESGQITAHSKLFCPGFYTLEGDDRRYRDWKRSGHGHVSVRESLIESCDVFFYDLALNLGIDRISEYMRGFGFGERTGIDLMGEMRGLMPSREWKRRVHNQPWFPGETLITGIGQGFMLATPLQLATHTAALATRGQRVTPMVVSALENARTGELMPIVPEHPAPVPIVKADNWKRILSAMVDVVHSPRGTAKRISHDAEYRIGGKTGTAQVFGIKQDEEYVEEDIVKRLRDHALFVGFAPADKPRIAVAVIVENGGSGSAVAAPVARKVMDAYLKEETE